MADHVLSVKIGDHKINPALALAPMAGITSQPFRLLAKEQGCQLLVSEMISAKGLIYQSGRSEELYRFSEEERPIGLQLFGSDPAVLAAAAQKLEALNPDFIDLNLGCPTPKVTKNGDGAALMRNPSLCSKIFKAVKNAVCCPVTVKLRKGWDEAEVTVVEIALRAEEAGLSMITVHGRTVSQKYSGQADWQIIAQVKKAVQIPVLGNGDVDSPASALAMIEQCAPDGLMIGRAARGNPWIFSAVLAALQGRPVPPKPTAEEIVRMALKHFSMLAALKGEESAVRQMRRHSSWYIRGFDQAACLRHHLVSAKSGAELKAILEKILAR